MGEEVVAATPAAAPPSSTEVVVAPHSNAQPKPKIIDPVDKYTALAVRGSIVAVGFAGVVIYLKKSGLFTKFQNVNQIPSEFIRREQVLKGRVKEVLPSGEIRVEHEPIMKIPFLPRKKNVNPGLLKLRLAGIELSPAGQQYLTKDLRIQNRPVTFTVIKGTDSTPDSADADVTVKKLGFGGTNLNVEVIRRGYAKVPAPDTPAHLKALQSVPAYSRLITRLLMSEKVADRRGVGVWERDTWVESVQSYPSQVTGIIRSAAITRAIVLVYNVTKDVILYGVDLTRQTYALILATIAYINNGYRKFSSGVDRLTEKYNRVKQRLK